MVTGKRPAVFLDRDGVLNKAFVREGRPFPPNKLEEVEVLPGVPDAVLQLKNAGFVTVMVTNQPDVVKGVQTRKVVESINDFVVQQTGIEAVYVCWCLEGDDCDCYKPKPGMILEAARELSIDLGKSFMVGDRWRDVGAGQNAGCKTIFIDYGYEEAGPYEPEWIVQDLPKAIDIIITHCKSGED